MLRKWLLAVFLVLFLLTPTLSNNPVQAAEPCLQTRTANGQYIQYFPVDSAGNPITQIPEGLASLSIKFSNLEPGYYRLEQLRSKPDSYLTGEKQAVNGE